MHRICKQFQTVTQPTAFWLEARASLLRASDPGPPRPHGGKEDVGPETVHAEPCCQRRVYRILLYAKVRAPLPRRTYGGNPMAALPCSMVTSHTQSRYGTSANVS